MPLRVIALRQRHAGYESLALVKAFFFADFDHRPGIGPVGGPAQRHLVDDSRTIDQPADHADIRPAQRRVVKNGGVFHLPVEHLLIQVFPGAAKGFRGAIEIEPVSSLILYLSQQDRFAAQRRRAGDPVAFRQHTDDLRVRVLAYLPNQGLTVGIRHPVLRFDGRFLRDALVKALFFCHVITFMIPIFTTKTLI